MVVNSNLPADESLDPSTRFAEVALGVADAATRGRVQRDAMRDDDVADALTWWEHALAPLADELPEVVPSAQVWAQLERTLRPAAKIRTARSNGSSRAMGGRRWMMVLAAGTALAAGIAAVVVWPSSAPNAPLRQTARLIQSDGRPGWLVTTDGDHHLAVRPLVTWKGHGARVPELWLVQSDQAPLALAVLSPDHPTKTTLAVTAGERLIHGGTLAVSVEPLGGSPLAGPTGPIVASGPLLTPSS